MKNIVLKSVIVVALAGGAWLGAMAADSAVASPDQAATTAHGALHGKSRKQVVHDYLHARQCGDVNTNDAMYPLTRRELHPAWFQSPRCRETGT